MPDPHAFYSKMLAERTASRNVFVLFYLFILRSFRMRLRSLALATSPRQMCQDLGLKGQGSGSGVQGLILGVSSLDLAVSELGSGVLGFTVKGLWFRV